ncbi:MAG: sulfur carrier protein ThiS [Rhodanobacteraceae bacterium]|nr:sulfur carrier protein ThiS [Rhodanobacteraceae bacterium]
MRIRLNGSERDIPGGTSIAALLQLAGFGERRVAVERNGEIVPRSQHAQAVVADGDQLEIVHAIGGG